MDAPAPGEPLTIGRYALFSEIASGGMATVYVGRLLGPVGFSRTVAVKRLLPNLAKDPEFVAMFLDEARLAARIHHPNVVPTLDVVATESELFLVMEYVHGESLARLVRAAATKRRLPPPRIAASIVSGALMGLHAAHEARDEQGEPLNIVHRDVSPQNVLVGADGIPRVVDFGVAKAAGRVHTTRDGHVKGKIGYMAPEQLNAIPVTRQADVYGAAVVLWETLTGKRLFTGDTEAIVVAQVAQGTLDAPSRHAPDVGAKLDEVVLRGLARRPGERFATAREMALALEEATGPVSVLEVAEWVGSVASDVLATRARKIADVERRAESDASPAHAPPASGASEVASRTAATPVMVAPPSSRELAGDVPSQVSSSLSITRASPVARPGRSRAVPIAAMVAGVVAVGGVLAYSARRGAPTPPMPATSSSSANAAESTAEPVAPPSASQASGLTRAFGADPSPPASSAPPATPPSPSASAPTSARPRPTPRSPPAPRNGAPTKPSSPFDILGPNRNMTR